MAATDADLLPPSTDPNTRKLTYRHVRARNENGSRTAVSVRDTPGFALDEPLERGGTNTGATPVETVIGALCGCDSVITHICAGLLGFKYAGIEYDAESTVDIRGPAGVKGVRPYFEKLVVNITMYTDEPADRVAKLERNVAQRCPVSNLIKDAGVDLQMNRTIRPAAAFHAAKAAE